MAFHNTQLDTSISYGAIGGPSWATTIQTTASGHEQRVSRASRARRRYSFAKTLMAATEWAALIAFWQGRRGHLHGWRLKDWADFTTASDGVSAPAATDVVLGTGDGVTTQFQLLKTYQDPDNVNDYTESLSLPVAGTILVAVASAPTVAYTITNPGGLITFTAAPGVGQVVTAGCEFDRGVRFDMANEALSQRIVPGYLGNVDQIEAVELLDETELPEMWYSGGALQQAVNQDVVLTLHYQFWNISNQSVGTINVWLPAPDRLPGGPMIFVVHNNGSSGGSLQLRDDIGATVGSTFAAGTTRRVALSRNSGATTWISYA